MHYAYVSNRVGLIVATGLINRCVDSPTMARHRKSRPDGGDLKDSTKEMLVISFLLSRDNDQSSATMIWSAWNPKNPRAAGSVASKKDRSLSLAGTIKVCTRLVSEGILVSITQKGYNKRDLAFYRFPSKGDQSYCDGFLRVAERTRSSPFLLMDSSYGRMGIKEVLMNKVEEDLDTDLGSWRVPVEWAAQRSPTAFLMICDENLCADGLNGTQSRTVKLQSFLEAIRGAISVDRISSYRGRLLNKDRRVDEAEELLEIGATSAGKEDRVLMERLQRFNDKS